MRAEEFMELYKRLESAIETQGLVDTSRYDNAVWGYMQSKAGARYRDTLNMCREIRNLLAHNPNYEGEPIVEPSGLLIEELKRIIRRVENPVLAIDVAVRGKDVFTAEMDDSLLYVMKRMDKNKYSHVPVTENGRFFGVLSESCVFTYMLMHTLVAIDDLTPVRELDSYLPIDAHQSERYVFLPRLTTHDELLDMFENEYAESKRLSAAFITENGKQSEKILGLVTPWDALGRPGKK